MPSNKELSGAVVDLWESLAEAKYHLQKIDTDDETNRFVSEVAGILEKHKEIAVRKPTLVCPGCGGHMIQKFYPGMICLQCQKCGYSTIAVDPASPLKGIYDTDKEHKECHYGGNLHW